MNTCAQIQVGARQAWEAQSLARALQQILQAPRAGGCTMPARRSDLPSHGVFLIRSSDLDWDRATLTELRDSGYRGPVLVFDVATPHYQWSDLLLAGANSLLDAGRGVRDLAVAVEQLCNGRTLLPPSVVRDLLRRLHEVSNGGAGVPVTNTLSVREMEIAELVAAQYSNKDIARSLGITISTTKNHLHRILRKLGAASRQEVFALMPLLAGPATDSNRL